MGHDFERNLAVGYFFADPFIPTVEPYFRRIREVYYAWPGLLTSRRSPVPPQQQQQQLARDLRRCRENGVSLDLLLNAMCYGDEACSRELETTVREAMKQFKDGGLLPDVVTTTSPFIAMVVKKYFPQTDVRASVVSRLNSTLAMEYASEYFDSFYMRRDWQRDLPTVKMYSEWAEKNGKEVCMLVNSNCLHDCPWQPFHAALLSHGFSKVCRDCSQTGFDLALCARMYSTGRYVEFLRTTWIRPEDLHLFEPYIKCFKLSTRDVAYPAKIVKAYAERRWNGDLLELIDPGFQYQPKVRFDNAAFPADWATSGIAAKCASNCTHCGRCEQVLAMVARPVDPAEYAPEPDAAPEPAFTITVPGRF